MKRIILLVYIMVTGGLSPLSAQRSNDMINGENAYFDGNYSNALPYLQRAAKAGNADACYYLFDMYSNGKGVATNGTIGGNMIKKAAEFRGLSVDATLKFYADNAEIQVFLKEYIKKNLLPQNYFYYRYGENGGVSYLMLDKIWIPKLNRSISIFSSKDCTQHSCDLAFQAVDNIYNYGSRAYAGKNSEDTWANVAYRGGEYTFRIDHGAALARSTGNNMRVYKQRGASTSNTSSSSSSSANKSSSRSSSSVPTSCGSVGSITSCDSRLPIKFLRCYRSGNDVTLEYTITNNSGRSIKSFAFWCHENLSNATDDSGRTHGGCTKIYTTINGRNNQSPISSGETFQVTHVIKGVSSSSASKFTRIKLNMHNQGSGDFTCQRKEITMSDVKWEEL